LDTRYFHPTVAIFDPLFGQTARYKDRSVVGRQPEAGLASSARPFVWRVAVAANETVCAIKQINHPDGVSQTTSGCFRFLSQNAIIREFAADLIDDQFVGDPISQGHGLEMIEIGFLLTSISPS
jgi:hypothetical protein